MYSRIGRLQIKFKVIVAICDCVENDEMCKINMYRIANRQGEINKFIKILHINIDILSIVELGWLKLFHICRNGKDFNKNEKHIIFFNCI